MRSKAPSSSINYRIIFLYSLTVFLPARSNHMFFKSFEFFFIEINFLVFLNYFDNVKNEFKK